jgi:hypothetical protein
MPATVKRVGSKWRVVEAGTGKVVKNRSGTAVDAGGHRSREAALRQARAINR